MDVDGTLKASPNSVWAYLDCSRLYVEFRRIIRSDTHRNTSCLCYRTCLFLRAWCYVQMTSFLAGSHFTYGYSSTFSLYVHNELSLPDLQVRTLRDAFNHHLHLASHTTIFLPLVGGIASPEMSARPLSFVVSGNLGGISIAQPLSGVVSEYSASRIVYRISLGIRRRLLLLTLFFLSKSSGLPLYSTDSHLPTRASTDIAPAKIARAAALRRNNNRICSNNPVLMSKSDARLPFCFHRAAAPQSKDTC